MIKQNITRFNKVKTVINESDIGDVFQSIYNTTISNMQNLWERVQVGLPIQAKIIILIFGSTIP